jgi:hypothetical protein
MCERLLVVNQPMKADNSREITITGIERLMLLLLDLLSIAS